LTGACQSDPVAFIRKHYCKQVVESDSQVKYIEEMTGIKVNVKPKRAFGYQSAFDWDDRHDYYGHRGLGSYKDKDKKNEESVPYWAPF